MTSRVIFMTSLVEMTSVMAWDTSLAADAAVEYTLIPVYTTTTPQRRPPLLCFPL